MSTILASKIAKLTADRIQSSERQGLILLFCIEIFIFASTFAQMVIAAIPDAQTAGALATLLFSLTMIFNGYVMIFQQPQRQ
jgi:ATP-binding cassette subfamily G (WHITE) protein 2 (PDR)